MRHLLNLTAFVVAVVAAADLVPTSGSKIKNTYVVIAPSKVRPGVNFRVSVNILAASSDVTVSASIEASGKVVASSSGVFKQGAPNELDIQVPHSLPRASYQLHVKGSGGVTFDDSRSVGFESKELSVFIQTDKAIYKPGDKVNYRVLAVYPDLKPYNGPVDIFISDANSNKIRHLAGLNASNGVVSESLSLSTQPVLGDWKIQASVKDASNVKDFTIDEYVLPKFEVDVMMPSYLVSDETTVSLTVKAKYTYGKPVKGKLNVAVKLLYSHQDFAAMDLPIYSTSLDIDGETKVSFPMSAALAITKYLNGRKFVVQANVTESLTGNTLAGSGSAKIYSTGSKLEFPSSNPSTFKPGLKYTSYLKVSQQDGVPVALSKTPVTVSIRVTSLKDPAATRPPNNYWWYPETTSTNLPDLTLSVPVNGLVTIPIDVPTAAKDVYISATYDKARASSSLTKSYSPSDSYMQLFLNSASRIQAGSSITFDVKATQPLGLLTYQILSKGQIVKVGVFDGLGQTTSTFSLAVTSSMAPNARIVVYYVRQDAEIVTDSISFDVAGVFNNKVAISINETQAEPGEPVKVTVTADPFSHAHLLAVDQSVLLLKSGNDITADDVSSELKSYDTIASPSNHVFGGFMGGARPMGAPRRERRMVWWPYPVFYGGSDATAIFQNAGVVVLTDALVFKHVEPIRYVETFNKVGGGFKPVPAVKPETANRGRPTDSGLEEPARTRNLFPETWLWSDSEIGSDGKADLVTSVPDTITSWVATAFAVHPTSGLGVAPTAAEFKVFRPFFVSLNLPYSVTRGEHVALQAIVFNYMSTDQQVTVTLKQSSGFFNIKVDAFGNEATSQGNAVQTVMVSAGQAKSVYFPIIPAQLGKVDLEVKAQSTQAADALRRQLLVEPEGVSKEFNVPVLIELTNGGQFSDTLDLVLPPNTVAGSELAKVSVIGDIMGPSISGIDNLLRMPTGCGEQTMLGLAPDVYVTDYLTSTNQLAGDIKDKALGFMEKGYQRELTYRHTDGSFSAFGNNDKSGSMWLTAFVARVIHQAKSYIFVDDDVIRRSISWMIQHQSTNGSFPEPGRVIHKNMQGKAGSGSSLTTFVVIAFLENQDLYQDTTGASNQFRLSLQKALTYLENEVAKSDDLYLLAMASYAFQRAGRGVTDQVLTKLDKLANHDGGLYHLHQPESKKATTGSWHSPNPTSAVDTEMTSYVLMTYALRRDVAFGRRIMQWITKQRNANGGFSSTQDTVVALNALSMMAEQLYSNTFNLHIDVAMDTSPKYSFQVDASNAVVMQRRETPTIPAKVKVDATGSGSALVEIAVFFNVESEIEDTTFDLQVMLVEETINKLKIQTCANWLGDGDASGMAVQEIGIPSGFQADLESFTKMEVLKRKETQDKKVILYFDEIGTKPVCVTFVAERVGLVAKSQPAVVRVYDYYEPSNQVTGFYQSQILKNSNVCDVCTECENCVTQRGR